MKVTLLATVLRLPLLVTRAVGGVALAGTLIVLLVEIPTAVGVPLVVELAENAIAAEARAT